mgnify:CR=1 FL=1
MPHSLSCLYIHLIFHIKKSSCVHIRQEDEAELYAYIASVIKLTESKPILINGTHDHVHIFCMLSKNISLAFLVKEIKRNSSRWIKSKNECYQNFAWQGGYAGFSVSQSLYDKTIRYIQSQKDHHRKKSFQEEYILFLENYKVEYNKEFIWYD